MSQCATARLLLLASQQLCTPSPASQEDVLCADGLFGIAAKAEDSQATATSKSAALYTTSYIILRSACADGLSLPLQPRQKATATSQPAALYTMSCIILRCADALT